MVVGGSENGWYAWFVVYEVCGYCVVWCVMNGCGVELCMVYMRCVESAWCVCSLCVV